MARPRWSFAFSTDEPGLIIAPKPLGLPRVLALLLLLGLGLHLGYRLPKAFRSSQMKAELWRAAVPLLALGLLARKAQSWTWHAFGNERLSVGQDEVIYRHGIGAWCQRIRMPRQDFKGLFVLKEPPEEFTKNWARKRVAPRLGLAMAGDDYYMIGFGLSEAEAKDLILDLEKVKGSWIYRA